MVTTPTINNSCLRLIPEVIAITIKETSLTVHIVVSYIVVVVFVVAVATSVAYVDWLETYEAEMGTTSAIYVGAAKHSPNTLETLGTAFDMPLQELCFKFWVESGWTVADVGLIVTFGADEGMAVWARY